jgi:cytochrome c biogenesis protein CcmG/thiol:disulfide interchange protein DsbE
MKAKYIIPLAIFIGLLVFFGVGLTKDPHMVPSPLINKPAPDFHLMELSNPSSLFSPADMRGKVWLLNVWASWCVSCRAEHATLVQYAGSAGLPIIGLNYKEVRGDDQLDTAGMSGSQEKALALQRAQAWLTSHGNPYVTTVMDLDGRVGIDYGVYGVPETFLIDKEGIIRYKQIGPVTPEALQNTILPMARKLNG